ncbi:MAG: universal stress protein [Phascolarctobacterium sp.]|nr:universal stress protein [Phascolarctobacterium sp.]
MGTFNKVLLATDLTPQSDNLLGCLVSLCPDVETEIVLAHVFDDDEDADPHGSEYKDTIEHLDGYKVKLQKHGYEEISVLTPQGDDADEVLNKIAEKQDVDLVMVASHGKGFFERTFHGSTTYDLAKDITIPLFIDRDDDDDNNDKLLANILVPTDFSKRSLEALNIIRSLREYVGKVHFLHVIEHSRDRQELRLKESDAEVQLEELVEELKVFGIDADFHISKGVASKRIDVMCERENISMIMLGRSGTGLNSALELGSTAENVILNVDRSILLLPADDNDD